MRKLNPVRKFALYGGLCIAGLSLSLGVVSTYILEDNLKDSEWASTAAMVQFVMEEHNLDSYMMDPNTWERPAGYVEAFRRLLRMPEITGMKVWDRRETVIWSDDGRGIGGRIAGNREVNQALAGRVAVALTLRPEAERATNRPQLGWRAAIFVPVRSKDSGAILGVVEVDQTPEELVKDIKRMQGVLWSIAISGGALLYVVLIPIVRRSYRTQLKLEARLREYTRGLEAIVQDRTRRLTHLNALSQLVASSLSQQPVFEHIVRAATELIEDSVASLWILDEPRRDVTLQARAGERQPHLRTIMRMPPAAGLVGEAAATGRPISVRDAPADPRFRDPDWGGAEGVHAGVFIPLTRNGRSLGVLAVLGRFYRAFSENDLDLLTSFAKHAAVAIENARLHEMAVRRGHQLATLNELSRVLTTVLDPQRIAKEVLAAAVTLVPGAAGRLWERKGDDGVLHAVAGVGLRDPEGGLLLRLRPGEGLVGLAADRREPIISENVPRDPRFLNKAWAEAEGLVSCAILPLVSGDQVHGVLGIYTRAPHSFTEEVNLLRSFAAQAAIAIENARLYEAVRRHAEDLEARVRERTAELEEALRVKVEFLGNMSHELRTPLNFVLGFTDLLKGGAAGPLTAKQAHYMDRIKSGGQRLLELITDLLDLSQIEAGKGAPHLTPVLLAPLVHEVLSLVHVQAAQKRLIVTTALDPWLPLVVADSGKLTSILAHLISNAVKFTPDGGTARVTAHRVKWSSGQLVDSSRPIDDSTARPIDAPAEWLELAVEDTGIGIPPNDLERVFVPFYQVDSSESRAYGGAGLGLALVRKLVELHGGRVWAESQGLGRGARFVVRLPRLAASRQARVLVVEDDAIYRDFLRTVLEKGAFAVEEAETGNKALTVLGTTPPDILVLDLGLPDLDGLEVLSQVRGNAHTRDLPILVLTGLSPDHAEGALARGADEFLTKPVSPQVLLGTVTRLVNGGREGKRENKEAAS